jgi:hypothetical protein
MTPATARFYEAVVNGQLTHSGDSRLARHVGNGVLREDARGARLAKERKDSPGGSTPPWPPSWPTTGPPPWPARPGTAFTSERATTPGASPTTRGRSPDRTALESAGLRGVDGVRWMRGARAHPTTDLPNSATNFAGVTSAAAAPRPTLPEGFVAPWMGIQEGVLGAAELIAHAALW